jgi:transcription initiation factor TFIIIB Brf1 subunit/transcription initiation factor TFIIB
MNAENLASQSSLEHQNSIISLHEKNNNILMIQKDESLLLEKKNLTSTLTESFKNVELKKHNSLPVVNSNIKSHVDMKSSNEDKYNVYGIGQNAAYLAHHERTSAFNLETNMVKEKPSNSPPAVLYNHTSRSLWEQGLNKTKSNSAQLDPVNVSSQLQTIKTPLKRTNLSTQVRLQTFGSPSLSSNLSPCLSPTILDKQKMEESFSISCSSISCSSISCSSIESSPTLSSISGPLINNFITSPQSSPDSITRTLNQNYMSTSPLNIPSQSNIQRIKSINQQSNNTKGCFETSSTNTVRSNQNSVLNQIRQNNLGVYNKDESSDMNTSNSISRYHTSRLMSECTSIPQSRSLPELDSYVPRVVGSSSHNVMTSIRSFTPTNNDVKPVLSSFEMIKLQESYGHRGFDSDTEDHSRNNSTIQDEHSTSNNENSYSYSDSLYSDTYDDIEPERETKTVTKSIMNDLRNVDIEESIKETADEIFRYIISLDPKRIFKVGNRRALIFYCVFEAFQRHGKKKSSTFILESLGYQSKDKSKAFDLVSQIYALNGMKLVISDDSDAKDEIIQFIEKMLKSMDHSSKIPISKQQMLQELNDLSEKILTHSSELQEKMPRCTAAGIIYYYFSEKGFNITKKDVKTFTETSTMTISIVYKVIQDLKNNYPHLGI